MAIWLIIFFLVGFLGNLYIYVHGIKLFGSPALKIAFTAIMLFFTLAFCIGRAVRLKWLSDFLTPTGEIWLSYMLYFFLALLFIDIIRAVNHFTGFLPQTIGEKKLLIGSALILIVFLVNIAGHINAACPAVREVSINLEKKSAIGSLKAVLVSDIHLGLILGKSHMKKLIALVNAQKPDIVLLAGDMFDGDIAPAKRERTGELFGELRAKYGVFAVTGNHEYIGNADEAAAYLEANGVTVLRNEARLIDGSFYIAGRDDASAVRIAHEERPPAKKITAGLDLSLPVIMMDHQPKDMAENREAGADIQLSGHTHRGQLWPVNLIVNRIWELPYGYKNMDGLHVYVSAGYGTWGPPVRTTGRPEIAVLNITFGN